MYTKSEIKKMGKGFHPSRTGKSYIAIVGRGEMDGNRKTRRMHLNEDNSLRNKSKLVVIGRHKYRVFTQPVYDLEGNKKWINHSIAV